MESVVSCFRDMLSNLRATQSSPSFSQCDGTYSVVLGACNTASKWRGNVHFHVSSL